MRKAWHIDRDRGWKRIEREVRKARRKPHAQVGIFGAKAAADHGGVPNIKIAATHELGLTLDHPGGTAYVWRGDHPMFVSNKVAAIVEETTGVALPRTRPHKIRIPERSFIRATVDQKSKMIAKRAGRLMGQVMQGTIDTRRALEILGLYVKGQMQTRISRGIAPPLKPSTIRRKGSAKPLIDKGQLRASIEFEVKNA